jgi:hypothetical protein
MTAPEGLIIGIKPSPGRREIPTPAQSPGSLKGMKPLM